MTEVSSNFWNWFLVNNLRLKFNQDFSVEVWTRFWSWVFAKILGCRSVKILNFGQDLESEVWSRPWRWSLIEISWPKFGQNSEDEFWPHLIWCDLKGGTLVGVLYPWSIVHLSMFLTFLTSMFYSIVWYASDIWIVIVGCLVKKSEMLHLFHNHYGQIFKGKSNQIGHITFSWNPLNRPPLSLSRNVPYTRAFAKTRIRLALWSTALIPGKVNISQISSTLWL